MKKRIKNIYINTVLVLPVYNAHPYFSFKNLGKKVHGEIWYYYIPYFKKLEERLNVLSRTVEVIF